MLDNTKRFILTGTPGSGKTSIIKELEANGFSVIHESATEVIADEQKQGNLSPWENPDLIDQIASLQILKQNDSGSNLQFHDRSIFCTYALARYMNYEPSAYLLELIEQSLKEQVYQNKVLFFENIGFVEHTEVRKISYEDALVFEQIHLDVYKQLGFQLIMVPKASIQERKSFIINCFI